MVRALRVDQPILIDGHLSEPAWQRADVAGHCAYHASTNWRNQSGFSGSVELEKIRAGFRPNETGLEDEAYRRARGNLTFVDNYSEGSTLNALLLRGRVFRQTDETGRLRQQYAQAEGSLHAGLFDFFTRGRVGEQREAGRLWSTRFAGVIVDYSSTWGFVRVHNQIGTRQGAFTWFGSLDARANLFERLTISLAAVRFSSCAIMIAPGRRSARSPISSGSSDRQAERSRLLESEVDFAAESSVPAMRDSKAEPLVEPDDASPGGSRFQDDAPGS